MSKEGLEKFRDELVGKGYRPAYPGASRKFRETARNVPIEIITSGEYPGDGKHCVVIDGVNTVELPKLIELKLASGISGLGRLRDLADVQELIRVRHLEQGMAARLDPSVREKYLELHSEIMRAGDQEVSPREES